jgi:tetratricopeptide (TPR) repeat protein
MFLKYKLIGIDYEFLDFRYNDELKIENILIEHINYKGRRDFNNNSYFTTNILIEKIQSMVIRNFTNEIIFNIFNLINEKCFQNIGGYAAIQCCNEIAYSFAENGNITESLKYFNLIIIHKSDIADSTVGGFYKLAAEYYINLGYKKEALIMIDMGLRIYPKLAVKKMKKLID